MLLLRKIVTSRVGQSSAFASATVQASDWTRKLKHASLVFGRTIEIAEAMGIDPCEASLPEPQGELQLFRCGRS